MRAQTAAERFMVDLVSRLSPQDAARCAGCVVGALGLDHSTAQAFVAELDDEDRETLYGALMVHQSCHAPRLPDGDVDLSELAR